ncbi:hypothetical protein [Streptomyces brasiliensis]|uniref:Uncharacterized protein n=1 Tax=Streptomyces brasiliensis TaxID=1954 RepID=A0A917UKL9_9ACTN|nr:hypothetical protein [Streptomyces brasiliensis]GGJ64244.1 hypothetical protein GCM10010121_088670 [Streptomyces brasiliensis]
MSTSPSSAPDLIRSGGGRARRSLGLLLLVFYASDSESGTNKYGANSKEVPAFA